LLLDACRSCHAPALHSFLTDNAGISWTYPRLVDRTISMDYKQEGETDGKKGHRTACVPEGI
jgi:hypothetical protein